MFVSRPSIRQVSFFIVLACLAVPLYAWAAGWSLTLSDPADDDDGPGGYKYPTDPVYKPKSFDLRKVEMTERGDDIEFRVTLGATIEDPWNSKEWDGNGFSLQFVQIYIDMDHQKGKGFVEPLPGLGAARFADDEAWDKVVLLSPQGKSRLSAELRAKAGAMKGAAVIPKSTRASGKTIVAVVKKSDLGGAPAAGWGFQVVVQSNEGYPDKGDILTRRVNEITGAHRFGGGNDGECDPHILDILAGSAKGDKSEIAEQHKALAYTCGSKVAHLPMIYPTP